MEIREFNPQKYLRPAFSVQAQIKSGPVAVVSASDAQRINTRIEHAVRQNEATRNDSLEAAARIFAR